MRPLTDKQKATYSYIVQFINEHGWAPSHREIADGTGASLNTSWKRVRRLELEGLIRCGSEARQLVIEGSTIVMPEVEL